MINKLRRRLTTLYATIIAIFLLSFIGIVFLGLIWLVYTERTNEVQALVAEFAQEQRSQLRDYNNDQDKAPNISYIEDRRDISGQVFYYIFDRNGRLVIADNPIRVFREASLSEIKSGLSINNSHFMRIVLPSGQSAALIIASREIRSESGYEGVIYVGKDVTAYYRVFGRVLVILVGVGLMFALLALGVGYILSGKVLIPVIHSLNCQKEFVADASHELRTPLSILLTSLEAIHQDTSNILSKFSWQVIEDMKDEILKLSKIIGDLLTLARADAGDIQLTKENFLFRPVAEQVMRTVKATADSKSLKITLSFGQPEISIYADRERIRQLLLILVDNAIKYTPVHGNITILVEQITQSDISHVKIVVQDSGIGISQADQLRIFDRFFRADKARSRESGGTGLGLAIASWIVHSHEGNIRVISQLGLGSSFIVSIPIPVISAK